MNTLRIYFSAKWCDSNSPCPWALCDASGSVLQQGHSPLAFMPATRDCLGIVAADQVLIFTTPQPAGKKRRWQAALPFIAEEYALTDPEDIHAVPAASSEAGKIVVSVITKSWLKQIVTATSAAGLPLRRLIAELLIPVLPIDSWTLVWDGHNGFLRTSPTTALALDSGDQQMPPLALRLSLAAAGVPRQIELRCIQSATPVPSWDLPVPLVLGATWDWQCAPLSDATPNLLWGEFAPSMRLFDGLPKLRPALFILLAALVIEIIGTHIEWSMLAHERHALTQSMEHIFRGSFGDDSTLVNAPLQMQRNLAELHHATGVTDDGEFLSMLDRAAPSLSSSTVQSLNYESGKLELNIQLAKSNDVGKLEKNLANSGFKVRTSDMHDLADGTQAKLTLSLESMQ